MAPQLNHPEIEALLGAYALDAVEPEEASVIDAHLTGCPRCRNEVAEHREAAALLAFSGASAPDVVWSRIAAGLDEAPPPFELTRPIPIRARRAPVRVLAPLAAVAAAAVLVVGVLSVQVVRQERRINQLAAISDQRGLDQAAAAAAVSPGARTVRLSSDDGTQVVDAVVLPDGSGYLVSSELPPLDGDETYQLWGVIGAQTISLGVLGGNPSITPFTAAGPLSALAITAERSGGVVASTNQPIVQGFVSTT